MLFRNFQNILKKFKLILSLRLIQIAFKVQTIDWKIKAVKNLCRPQERRNRCLTTCRLEGYCRLKLCPAATAVEECGMGVGSNWYVSPRRTPWPGISNVDLPITGASYPPGELSSSISALVSSSSVHPKLSLVTPGGRGMSNKMGGLQVR